MYHKITVQSPFARTPDPSKYAGDPFWQHKLLAKAVMDLLDEPFSDSRDLRGYRVHAVLHPDGLHATAELLKSDASTLEKPPEDMFTSARTIMRSTRPRFRGVENVDLPD